VLTINGAHVCFCRLRKRRRPGPRRVEPLL
jgi:hypothetical protein